MIYIIEKHYIEISWFKGEAIFANKAVLFEARPQHSLVADQNHSRTLTQSLLKNCQFHAHFWTSKSPFEAKLTYWRLGHPPFSWDLDFHVAYLIPCSNMIFFIQIAIDFCNWHNVATWHNSSRSKWSSPVIP